MYYTLVLKVEYFSKYWIYHLKYYSEFCSEILGIADGDVQWIEAQKLRKNSAVLFLSLSLSFHKEKRHGFRYFTPPNKLRWIDLILHHIFPLGGWSVTFLPSHIIMHTHHTLTRVSNFARIVSRGLVIWLSFFSPLKCFSGLLFLLFSSSFSLAFFVFGLFM